MRAGHTGEGLTASTNKQTVSLNTLKQSLEQGQQDMHELGAQGEQRQSSREEGSGEQGRGRDKRSGIAGAIKMKENMARNVASNH